MIWTVEQRKTRSYQRELIFRPSKCICCLMSSSNWEMLRRYIEYRFSFTNSGNRDELHWQYPYDANLHRCRFPGYVPTAKRPQRSYRFRLWRYLPEDRQAYWRHYVLLYISLEIKIGSGLDAAISGWLLDAIGFIGGGVAVQPDSVTALLNVMYLWLSAIFWALVAFFLTVRSTRIWSFRVLIVR